MCQSVIPRARHYHPSLSVEVRRRQHSSSPYNFFSLIGTLPRENSLRFVLTYFSYGSVWSSSFTSFENLVNADEMRNGIDLTVVRVKCSSVFFDGMPVSFPCVSGTLSDGSRHAILVSKRLKHFNQVRSVAYIAA